MKEVRKVADTIIPMLRTEEDCLGYHPELGFKVPIFDEAMWVEETMKDAKGMDIHSQCEEGSVCLPIDNLSFVIESEGGVEPTPRMVQQIKFEFYAKPMKPKLVILAESALPWQQKRTVLTQECI